MRFLTNHKATEADKSIEIEVMDAPGAGGAHHEYAVRLNSSHTTQISFQCGPVKDGLVNGLTQEVLLAIVIDRLECFQAGKFSCSENEAALSYVRSALGALKSRTAGRVARNVEGTLIP